MLLVIEIARQTFLLQLRSRLYWTLMALSICFAGMFLFVPPNAARVGGDVLFEVACFLSGFTLVLPFIVLYMAVQAVHGDLEDRTSVYLFTRPVSRVWILLGKWLAVLVLGALFAGVAITALFVVIRYCGRPWEDGALPSLHNYSIYLLGAGLGVFGYASMGVLLGAFFRRPMLLSMFYIVVEQVASRMPAQAGIHSLTVADPVRRFLEGNLEGLERGVRRLLVGRIGQRRSEVLEYAFQDPITSMCKLAVVVLALALWVYTRRQYDARPVE